MLKGQTALEYLMTYGWAILIVIIAVGALFGLGLTKPCRWVGTQVSGFTGGGFEVATPRFDSAGYLEFDLKRIGAATVTVGTVDGTFKTVTKSFSVSGDMATGNTTAVNITGFATQPSGDCYSVDAKVNYNEGGRAFTAAGKVSGTIEA